MFELPGLNTSGDVRSDLASVRRYLARLIPQLEQEMQNLGTDNFTSAYNERLEGLVALTGAQAQKTSAEALAEHILDKSNPHAVTLAQLGHEDPVITMAQTGHGWYMTLCGLMIQARYIQLSGEGAADGSLYMYGTSLGSWDTAFGTLSGSWVKYRGDGWMGAVSGATETSAGNIQIWNTAAAISATVAVYGIGGVSNGGSAKESDFIS